MDNNEHVKGVQESIEHIIGVPTTLKVKKKTEADQNKEAFVKMIHALEEVNARSSLLGGDFSIDLTKYDESFYNIIDNLIVKIYGADVAELIFYYIYDRINPDGSINELVDEKSGKSVKLESAEDLYMLINAIMQSQAKKKK